MQRLHIHFSADETLVRKNSQVLIYINVEACIRDAIVFYKSENGVLLSTGIDGMIGSKYFLKITDRGGATI